jgi:hypothetical protein
MKLTLFFCYIVPRRFPKGAPWTRFYGIYKDLHLDLVMPGKDAVFGNFWMVSHFLYLVVKLASPLK